ncbi:hypothetical protein KSF_022350 [Reticulibacter mediterranei]|uniref:Aminoglycoside phosphotransferase domain-containing protein n=1 Tax=Reticulibacter mediterranei TaxID=2778369 RepID=A0A8J3IIT4_9CHLR|nr:hypothetical protein [Reticulibacter mediterranei]GHO92187.1 hypothetical protein KSF_022350 [Reticulibacter mediterranei]
MDGLTGRLMKNYERDERGMHAGFFRQSVAFHIQNDYIDKCQPIDIKGEYVVEGQRNTDSALIYDAKDKKTGERFCFKVLKPLDGVRNTKRKKDQGDNEDEKERLKCLIRGLDANRMHAPGVVLGISCLKEHIEGKSFFCEKFYRELKLEDVKRELREVLAYGKQYALVMRYLADECRLEVLLESGSLDSQTAMNMLAQQVADKHKLLKEAPLNKRDEFIFLSKKLRDNGDLLNKIDCIRVKDESIKNVIRKLEICLKAKKEIFKERRDNKCIKRCHGDLKPGNLWLSPALPLQSAKLLALDCIDFNRPDFYYIDTLCDVAMLAITLEHSFTLRLGKEKARGLVEVFLDDYLEYMEEEKEKVLFLLDYYMAEKAIVCAYTSYNDGQTFYVVEQYLELASMHAERLTEYLPVFAQIR